MIASSWSLTHHPTHRWVAPSAEKSLSRPMCRSLRSPTGWAIGTTWSPASRWAPTSSSSAVRCPCLNATQRNACVRRPLPQPRAPNPHLGPHGGDTDVPVTIELLVELNGAAWASQTIPTRVHAGVDLDASLRLGLQWDTTSKWRKVQSVQWENTFWEPTWGATTEGGWQALNASMRAAVSPEIILVLWGAVPLEVKPKLVLGAHFGDQASALKRDRSVTFLPLNAAHRRAQQEQEQEEEEAPACLMGDAYALSTGLNVGLGIEVPPCFCHRFCHPPECPPVTMHLPAICASLRLSNAAHMALLPSRLTSPAITTDLPSHHD